MEKEYVSGKYNPFNLNAIWFDSTILRGMIPMSFPIKNTILFYFKCIILLVKIIFLALLRTPFKMWFQRFGIWHSYDNAVIFIIPTINNQKAVDSILSELKKSSKKIGVISGLNYECFPMISICLYSFRYILWLTKEYKHRDDYEKKVILYNLPFFLLSPGVIRFYKKALKHIKPECVVLANDHMSYYKGLELVCEEYGIKTIYVQHASVSNAFPELHFAYSFLDGKDSFNKYTNGEKKSHGEIFLLGALRYDALSYYRVRRNYGRRGCIGIAINDIDDNNIVNAFCNKVLERFPNIDIRVRSHPALKNKPFVFDKKDRITYKCATEESMIDYLDKIDIQVSGDSGVHFDAIVGGVPTFAFNFSCSKYEDNYGYAKEGLIKYAQTVDEAVAILEENSMNIPVELVSFYDASYGKKYAGNCSKIVADFILNDYSLEFLKSKYGIEKRTEEGKSYYIFAH